MCIVLYMFVSIELHFKIVCVIDNVGKADASSRCLPEIGVYKQR